MGKTLGNKRPGKMRNAPKTPAVFHYKLKTGDSINPERLHRSQARIKQGLPICEKLCGRTVQQFKNNVSKESANREKSLRVTLNTHDLQSCRSHC